MSDTPVLNNEFIRLGQLRDELGIARSTLRRRLRLAGVMTFLDPGDERTRLLRREDAEALRQPKPTPRKATAAEAVAA